MASHGAAGSKIFAEDAHNQRTAAHRKDDRTDTKTVASNRTDHTQWVGVYPRLADTI